MEITFANTDDINYIDSVSPAFSSFYPENIPVDPQSVNDLLHTLIDGGHPLFVAKEGDVYIGCIGGTIQPFIYNSNELAATELFLWVEPEKREGGTADRLLEAFEDYAVQVGCKIISMCTTSRTKFLGGYYESKGYKLVESSYMRIL